MNKNWQKFKDLRQAATGAFDYLSSLWGSKHQACSLCHAYAEKLLNPAFSNLNRIF